MNCPSCQAKRQKSVKPFNCYRTNNLISVIERYYACQKCACKWQTTEGYEGTILSHKNQMSFIDFGLKHSAGCCPNCRGDEKIYTDKYGRAARRVLNKIASLEDVREKLCFNCGTIWKTKETFLRFIESQTIRIAA